MKYEHRDFYFLVKGVLDHHEQTGGSAETALSTIKELHARIGKEIYEEPKKKDYDAYAAHSADQCDDPTCYHF